MKFVHALLKMDSVSGRTGAVPSLCSSLLLLLFLRRRETRIILACKVSHAADNLWRSASPCQNCSFPVGVLCFWFYMLWVLFAVLQCVMFVYVLLALWLSWLFTSKLVPSLFSPFATLLSENVISSFSLLNHRLSC